MVDIFSEGAEVGSTWAKFEKVGDGVQGTYIAKEFGKDSYGNDQTIYKLKGENGNIILVGVRNNKVGFHNQMDAVNFGQIVGIKLTATIPNDKGNDTKIQSVFASPNIVDEAWLKANKGEVNNVVNPENLFPKESDDEEIVIDEIPFDDAKPKTKEEKLAEISNLASEKLQITDPTLIKDKVMEETGLPFIESNLDNIIEKLKAK